MLAKLKPLALAVTAAGLCLAGTAASAKVKGDTIVLGAAVSVTGKYSTNGKHTMNGYNLAIETINEAGGVEVAGKTY